MSGNILDILNGQNLTRAQGAYGVYTAANQVINSNNLNTAGRAAIAGSLVSQIGGILTNFQPSNSRAPDRGFNITNFTSKLNNMGGLASTSKFLVNITPPPCVVPDVSGPKVEGTTQNGVADEITATGNTPQKFFTATSGYDLLFLCPKTTLPGMSLATSQIFHLGYGIPERRPIRPNFNTITLNFFIDVSGISLGFFTRWMSNIVNFNNDAVGDRTSSGAFYNEVHYKSNYATKVSIYVFDVSGNSFIECDLIDAYPVSIGEVDLNWSNMNDIAMVPITFTYRTWKSNFTPATEISNGSLRNMTLASILFRVGSTVQAGSNLLRRPTNVMDAFNLVRNGSNIISSIF